jgi:glyoxylase-like metal-dependent hydrolase (beta-lactamase superfamily II)
LAQLAAAGTAAEDVTDVVITHLHFDHFNGLTQEADGAYHPAFLRAQCYVSQRDWQEFARNVQKPGSLTNRTVGVLERAGLLTLIAGEHRLAAGVTVLPAPGETPGHQIVRVHSAGETLYVLGDLYHHALEVEHPPLNVSWADATQMAASKEQLVAAALRENALLVAAHIPGFGRLQRGAHGVRWVEVEIRD